MFYTSRRRDIISSKSGFVRALPSGFLQARAISVTLVRRAYIYLRSEAAAVSLPLSLPPFLTPLDPPFLVGRITIFRCPPRALARRVWPRFPPPRYLINRAFLLSYARRPAALESSYLLLRIVPFSCYPVPPFSPPPLHVPFPTAGDRTTGRDVYKQYCAVGHRQRWVGQFPRC